MFVPVASTTKLGDQLAGQLEDEDSARFVVNHDHMTVLVHGHALRPHQPTGAQLRLMDGKYGGRRTGKTWDKVVFRASRI